MGGHYSPQYSPHPYKVENPESHEDPHVSLGHLPSRSLLLLRTRCGGVYTGHHPTSWFVQSIVHMGPSGSRRSPVFGVTEQLITDDNTGISGQLGFPPLAFLHPVTSFLSPVLCSADSHLFSPRMSVKTTVPFAAVQAAPFTFSFLPRPLQAGERVSSPSRLTKAIGVFS